MQKIHIHLNEQGGERFISMQYFIMEDKLHHCIVEEVGILVVSCDVVPDCPGHGGVEGKVFLPIRLNVLWVH